MPKSFSLPKDVTIKAIASTQVAIANVQEYSLYVKGSDYKELPNDANIRDPEDKSRPYNNMMDTLLDEPENFFLNNLGISVLAETVQLVKKTKDYEEYKIHFKEQTGIINGGHTQRALLDSQNNAVDLSSVIVKLIVTVANLSAERITEIANCKNISTQPKDFSLDYNNGKFDSLKSKMDSYHESHIRWYENKKVSGDIGIDADEIIRILNLFDIKKYSSNYSTSSDHPIVSFNSKTKAYSEWCKSDGKTLYLVYPLVNDIMDLYEMIQLESLNKTGLKRLEAFKKEGKPMPFSGKIPDRTMPFAFLWPNLAAYRANIYYDDKNKKIGWKVDPTQLYKDTYRIMFENTKQRYKKEKNDVKKVGNDDLFWKDLYSTMLIQYVEPRFSANGNKPFKEYSI